MTVGLTRTARALRRRQTEEETILWRHLRNRQMNGWKFRRQAPRASYVVDFVCVEAGLVIELDGTQHRTIGQARDEVRTRILERDGLRLLRFDNQDVLSNLEGVLDEIYGALGEKEAPSPGTLRLGATRRPLPKGRGEAEASQPAVEDDRGGRAQSFSLSPRGEGRGEGALPASQSTPPKTR